MNTYNRKVCNVDNMDNIESPLGNSKFGSLRFKIGFDFALKTDNKLEYFELFFDMRQNVNN